MPLDEHTGELGLPGRKLMPITRRDHMGLASSKRKTMLTQWKMASPAREKTLLDGWVTRKEGPALLSREEILRIRRAVEAARKKAHPRETG